MQTMTNLLLIDTAGLNAFVAFSLANPGWQSTSTGTRKLDKRRLFLIAAGENLIQPLLAERASNMKICRRPSIARAMASIDMAHAYTVVASDSADRKRGRCAHCPRSKENKVATKCTNCCNFVCGQHATKTINYACISCERNSDSE
jgi:hypothetical protein